MTDLLACVCLVFGMRVGILCWLGCLWVTVDLFDCCVVWYLYLGAAGGIRFGINSVVLYS